MKRITFFILAALVVTAFPLYAEHEDKEGDHSMCDKKMMGMPMMMQMMQKSVTATNDGGVVIVAGNKITKYDKDLNVVKEVESKMDMEAMMKNMGDMMKKCPMMKGKKSDTETAPLSAAVATDSPEDHAAHH